MAKAKKSSHAVEDLAADRPSSHSLYETLGVERSATQEEIKKAYHRMALKLHPDKNQGDEQAKERFQTLQRVFSVLSDPQKREVYDRTGRLEDTELTGELFSSLYDYYREMFAKVTEDDIEAFEAEYRGSEEEAMNLRRYYKQFKGDMNKVFSWIMCSSEELDSHRFKDIIDKAILSGELEESKKYRKWAAEVAKKPPPAGPVAGKPAARKKKAKGGGKDAGEGKEHLFALIKHKQAYKSSEFFSQLEAKYGQGKSGKGGAKRKASAEPSEEEFEAAQQRLLGRQEKGNRHKGGKT